MSTAVELPGWGRLCLLALGLTLAGLLATARCLQPNPAGYGTHRQLGLGPCSMMQLFGRPCPSCGMTTAWAWLVRGRIDRAAKANAGGVLCGLLATVISPWAIATAWRGRWFIVRPFESLVITVAVGVVLVTLVDWARRCWIGEWL